MAQAKKASTVTRIKATDTPKKERRAKAIAAATPKQHNGFVTVLLRIGGYFKGSWYELRQVRWPDRKQTWALTLAVLLFSAFFAVVILLLDALFQWITGFIY